MKRLFDILASGIGILVLSPIFLVIAVWIKLDSQGPVFYRQVRVGKDNIDFRILKFRSMRVGSEKAAWSPLAAVTHASRAAATSFAN